MEERQERSGRQKNILMVCSDLSQVKGGMVSVVKNLLGYGNWEEFSICYIAAHVEGNAVRKLLFFAAACIKVFFLCCFTVRIFCTCMFRKEAAFTEKPFC